jgi:hypothetical protein
LHKYRLGSLTYNKGNSSVFSLYDLKQKENCLFLKLNSIVSSTVDDLFNAFRKNDDIPPVDDFIERLQIKINSDIKLSLRLDMKQEESYLDISRPTSTGKVREGSSNDDEDE